MLYDEKLLLLVIRNRRLQLNYTQEYVSARLNMSQNAYSKFELGGTGVTLQRLCLVCDALEIPIEEMLTPALQIAR